MPLAMQEWQEVGRISALFLMMASFAHRCWLASEADVPFEKPIFFCRSWLIDAHVLQMAAEPRMKLVRGIDHAHQARASTLHIGFYIFSYRDAVPPSFHLFYFLPLDNKLLLIHLYEV